ncbi:hypothetical protein CCMSSC00406_0005282 [Pleurotus cornucopiae]|uniref:Uncharacterized protein n=1 Tax=Pleurotus cornucopiae TaxID=5321 RepID=A0ACB7II39_PLECO|nr:hypothetical protein CCMSSC00406_0005282 [Pleurotus cornucopiae]
MASIAVPSASTILVIGGGPGGSYSAAVLAREGLDVVLLEADKFPRYHVGESQLASLRHFLRFIDLEKEFEEFGFQRKDGAGFKLNRHKREGYTDFVSQDPNNFSWNTVRSQADELMLRHASKCGAKVFEETKVTELEFEGSEQSGRPVAALWKQKSGATGRITFSYLVDASGRNGIMSTRYLKNRQFNSLLKNVACWGYWEGTGKYLPGTSRENSPLFEALADESGWAWFIPLHDGTTSVGIVMNQDISNEKKAKAKESGEDTSLVAHYLSELKRAPNVLALIGDGVHIKKSDAPLISAASDYSYSATSYAGPHYRIVGDAGAFIDPYFSSGVHLAISGVIQGNTDVGRKLQGDDLRRTVEFCAKHAYEPSLPEERKELVEKFGDPLRVLSAESAEDSEQVATEKRILKGVAIRKLMRTEDIVHIDNFVADNLLGYKLRLIRGSLGLEKVL